MYVLRRNQLLSIPLNCKYQEKNGNVMILNDLRKSDIGCTDIIIYN